MYLANDVCLAKLNSYTLIMSIGDYEQASQTPKNFGKLRSVSTSCWNCKFIP